MFNKASFKFKKDDVFLSHFRANPKFKIYFHLNRAKINSGLDHRNEYYSDVLSIFEYNHSGFVASASLEKNSKNKIRFFNDDLDEATWLSLEEGDTYSSIYTDITSSLQKHYIIKDTVLGGGGTHATVTGGITFSSSLDKLGSLYNIYNYYSLKSPYFDFDNYVAADKGQSVSGSTSHPRPRTRHDYISLVEVPRLYRGNKINEGSLKLSFYYTGTLCAEAQDTNKNGVIYESVGPRSGSAIGTVLYPEGLIVITASYALNNKSDGYLNPRPGFFADPGKAILNANWQDNPRWAHFMSYKSFITSSLVLEGTTSSYAPVSSSYTIEFEGETVVPTYTMMAHADKNDLIWSNNPTFIERKSDYAQKTYDQIYVSSTGSKHYEENHLVSIKNIVSSSFNNYSESYSPITYISKIGIYDEGGDLIAVANLATPVKKTTKQDYTFKLKLDL